MVADLPADEPKQRVPPPQAFGRQEQPADPLITPSQMGQLVSDNPSTARFLSRVRLNRAGSEKTTWHIDIDLAGSGIDYTVGDSFGLFPINDPALVEAVLKALGAPADFPIGGRTLREVLTDGVSLAPAPDMLFQLYSYLTGGARRLKAKALASGEGDCSRPGPAIFDRRSIDLAYAVSACCTSWSASSVRRS